MPFMSGAPETSLYELGLYMALLLVGVVIVAIIVGLVSLVLFFYPTIFGAQLAMQLCQHTGLRVFNYLAMMFRSITRNLLRTSLTFVAVFVLVAVISAFWSILLFIDSITEDKDNNLKAIITEKHQ